MIFQWILLSVWSVDEYSLLGQTEGRGRLFFGGDKEVQGDITMKST